MGIVVNIGNGCSSSSKDWTAEETLNEPEEHERWRISDQRRRDGDSDKYDEGHDVWRIACVLDMSALALTVTLMILTPYTRNLAQW